tara:strand:- start:1888 stop:2097 length:210 start_codon:yes stop_codon:yes gene_type:complete
MINPTLPVLRIHAMYDQGMQAVDIYEFFDCVHSYDAIIECVLEYTATGGDWDNEDDFISDDDAGEDAYY